MPNPIIKRFTVEGAGEFPLDMLRSDQCQPAGVDDSARIAEHHGGADSGEVRRRPIRLETVAKYAPNRQRGLSFSWRVIDQLMCAGGPLRADGRGRSFDCW